MARTVTDALSVEMDSSQTGHIRLHSVMQIDVNETDSAAEVVKTMRAERKAVGHKGGISDYEIDISAKRFQPAEVDWYALKRNRVLCTFYYQEMAGKTLGDRYVIEDVRITEVSASGNAEGEADLSIKGIALDHYPEA